jgi:hypothetical protein
VVKRENGAAHSPIICAELLPNLARHFR